MSAMGRGGPLEPSVRTLQSIAVIARIMQFEVRCAATGGLVHEDVRIVILRNVLPKEDHAAVAARVDGRWLILDNAARAGARHGYG